MMTETVAAIHQGHGELVTKADLRAGLETELEEFSAGHDGVRPSADTVQIARALSEAAVRHVPHPEITVDIDGELSFDMRLRDGRLVLAELGLDGQIDVGVYGPDDQMLEHNAEATCEYLRSIIESCLVTGKFRIGTVPSFRC